MHFDFFFFLFFSRACTWIILEEMVVIQSNIRPGSGDRKKWGTVFHMFPTETIIKMNIDLGRIHCRISQCQSPNDSSLYNHPFYHIKTNYDFMYILMHSYATKKRLCLKK